jgi:cytochrome P450
MRPDAASLMDPAIQEDPYDYYRVLREQAPVYRMPDLGAYLVTRYADVQHVIAHPEIWSINLALHTGSSMFRHPEALELLEREGWARDTKLSTDPPEHKGYRAIVNAAFTAGRVKQLEPFVRATVDALIDDLIEAGECEFMQRFCWQLPIRVISRILGVPEEDADRIKRWSDIWVEPLGYGLSREREIEVARAGVELQRYLARKLEQKTRAPCEDVLTALALARLPDGSELPLGHKVNLAEHIIVGGHETVTSALAAGLLLLLRNPDVERELRADPSLTRNFVEEVLRLESPSQGFFRYALRDAELRGVTIPAASMVHLRFGAANRDPEQFPDPDRLDLHRKNAGSHMAFSQGEHHCLGAPLARLELVVSFGRLLERLGELRLAADRNGFEHVPGLSLRTLKELYIRCAPAEQRCPATGEGES